MFMKKNSLQVYCGFVSVKKMMSSAGVWKLEVHVIQLPVLARPPGCPRRPGWPQRTAEDNAPAENTYTTSERFGSQKFVDILKSLLYPGSSCYGRQNGRVSVRVTLHRRDSVPGDAQLHGEGALHERGKERGHHIRGSQQRHFPSGKRPFFMDPYYLYGCQDPNLRSWARERNL